MPVLNVILPPDDHARLKRLAAVQNASYAVVIGRALEALERGPNPPGECVAYGRLPDVGREAWRRKARQYRAQGGSFATVAKQLWLEGLAGADGFPLNPATVRGMLLARPNAARRT